MRLPFDLIRLPRRPDDAVELLVTLEADNGERLAVQVPGPDVSGALARAVQALPDRGWLPVDWRYL